MLDPQAQMVVDAMNALPRVVPSDDNVEAVRAGFGGLLLLAGDPEPVFAIDDRDAGGVPVRIYRPSPDPGLPVIVYLHGGGWTIGSVEQFDPITRQVANAAGAIVVSVDYRLAPEHPFPAGLEDCWHALRWTAEHASTFGGDGSRLAVMGDSAGGNLAAVCALQARDAGSPDLALQVLVYPVTDCDFTTSSYRENGDGYLLTEEQMRWFFSCYVRDGTDPTDWRVSPLRARDVHGVAPALVLTAEYDPLRDEGEAYARKLAEEGVAVHKHRYDGMVHAFFGLSATFDAGREAVTRVGTAARRAFGTLDG
ncbi:MAG TPA: alpha/beta hydrolase [Acidimicrobiia bacterium]|nr:alpha/beta hydrolase [Acidimicrobiia bacterium]